MMSSQLLRKTLLLTRHFRTCSVWRKHFVSLKNYSQYHHIRRCAIRGSTALLQAECRLILPKYCHSSANIRICSALQKVNQNVVSALNVNESPLKVKNHVTQVLEEVEVALKKFPDCHKSTSEWETFKASYLEKCPKCDKIFNFKVMETLHSEDKVELAISFKDFIDSKNQSNIITDAQFMLTCADMYPDITLKEYSKLKDSFDLKYVNSTLGRLLIRSLCLTTAWKESVDIYERMVILNDNKLNISLLNILIAAVCNKDYHTFFTMLGKHETDILQMFPKHFSTMVFELWKEEVISLDSCFELLKLNNLNLTKDQMQHIQEYCDREEKKQFSIQSQKEIVDRVRGVCRGCGEKLPGSYISLAQFQSLAHNLVESAYGTQHVYKNTTPEELRKFRAFLEKKKPFDFVVDGLNVFHQRYLSGVRQLLYTLKKLKPNARILVIKKSYILNNLRDREVSRILAMASFYDIDKQSADDLFLLLTAFQSGPDTRVVSDDNFRDHKAKLNTQEQYIFKRWQSYRQILYTSNTRNNNTLQMPACYDSQTVESEDGWHVPYEYVQGQADFINSHLFMCIKKANWMPSDDLVSLRKARQTVIEEKMLGDITQGAVIGS